jgi:hypothetical protein
MWPRAGWAETVTMLAYSRDIRSNLGLDTYCPDRFVVVLVSLCRQIEDITTN